LNLQLLQRSNLQTFRPSKIALSLLAATFTKNRGWGQSRAILHLTVHPTLPPIFRTLFQVPYPVSLAFAALTKTTGVYTNNSQLGTNALLSFNSQFAFRLGTVSRPFSTTAVTSAILKAQP
jgi:hypothetical protein